MRVTDHRYRATSRRAAIPALAFCCGLWVACGGTVQHDPAPPQMGTPPGDRPAAETPADPPVAPRVEAAEPRPGRGSAGPRANAAPGDPASAARLAAVRQAIEQGVEIDRTDEHGRTALMMASFDGYTDVAALMLEHGAGVDRLDSSGRSALMYAASGPFPETVLLLLEHGAEVDRVDTVESWTALMLAAAEGNRAVVETLLRHGADSAIVDQDGDAAVDHARAREQTEIVTLLENLTARDGGAAR